MRAPLNTSAVAQLAFIVAVATLALACEAHAPQPAVPHAPLAPPEGQQVSVPKVGDDPAEIEAYLRELKDEVEREKERYVDTRRSGDEPRQVAWKRLGDARSRYEGERDRLWPEQFQIFSEGMTIAGAVIGGLGLFGGAGVVLGAIGDGSEDAIGVAALGGIIGAVCLAGSIPLLVVGADQVPREPAGRAGNPGPVVVRAGPSGVTLTGSF